MDHPSMLAFKGLSVARLCPVTPGVGGMIPTSCTEHTTHHTVSTKCDYSLSAGPGSAAASATAQGPRPTPTITRTWLGCPLGCPLGPEEGTPNLLGGAISQSGRDLGAVHVWRIFSVINENNFNQLNLVQYSQS